MKILIVDDHIAIRSHLQKCLEKHGYEAVTAANGEIALKKAAEIGPDLILMDIKMPVMDGLEALRQLKAGENTAGIPVVMLTGMDELEDENLGMSLGADAYIKKPVVVADVLRLVEKYKALP